MNSAFDSGEYPDYYTKQIITCLGNKRALLPFIEGAIRRVCKRLDRKKLSCIDVFSGSGIVSRLLKRYSRLLIANDLERYAEVCSRCYLTNTSSFNRQVFEDGYRQLTERLENRPWLEGLISCFYAPKDEGDIQPGERVFYTRRNAMYIDTVRSFINTLPDEIHNYFLGPLLVGASVHTNTAGVFKGFYKNPKTDLGKFGGRNSDALLRICGPINLAFPIFSRYECECRIFRQDANELVTHLSNGDMSFDLAYIDPPYNQHPYGSNYFMLNLVVDYKEPENISRVSGIPCGWNRSGYNNKVSSPLLLAQLTKEIPARFLLISFNSEGFISPGEMERMLKNLGKVETLKTNYNTFRASRNLHNREIHLKELLYIVEKK